MDDLWSQIFNFANYGELLALVKNSILAGALLGDPAVLILDEPAVRDVQGSRVRRSWGK